jgi:hypothetical protein
MSSVLGRKRKHSLLEGTVNLTNMEMALRRLNHYKEELDGIEETEYGMSAVMKHVKALEEILNGAKRPVC